MIDLVFAEHFEKKGEDHNTKNLQLKLAYNFCELRT